MAWPSEFFRGRLLSLEEARIWREDLRLLGAELVFTNGVFDLMHAGHAGYLAQARSLGDALLVGVNSDASVRRLQKGVERPLMSQEDRAFLLLSLRAVDAVVCFDEDTPLDLIRLLEPDVLAKGADYSLERIVGAAETLARGGRVERISLVEGRSTTALVERLRRSFFPPAQAT
jgi:D-beta-D-heptose 7-phosphate kinase/D-beta-D-heptose 1-phosphate adenosyltransferase